MAVVPEQGPLNFVPMTLAATTVNSQGAVVAGTFLVNPGANVNVSYSVAPTTLRTVPTGLPQANAYPFIDPVYQATPSPLGVSALPGHCSPCAPCVLQRPFGYCGRA